MKLLSYSPIHHALSEPSPKEYENTISYVGLSCETLQVLVRYILTSCSCVTLLQSGKTTHGNEIMIIPL